MTTAPSDADRANLFEHELELLDLGLRRRRVQTTTAAERRQANAAVDALVELAGWRRRAAARAAAADDPPPLATIRGAIRKDLGEYVDNAGEWTDADAQTIAALAYAYTALGGDLELESKVNAEAARLEGELRALETYSDRLGAAIDELIAFVETENLTADYFTGRLERLPALLNRLEELREAGR